MTAFASQPCTGHRRGAVALRLGALALAALLLVGCTTWRAPEPPGEAPWVSRAVRGTLQGVNLSAAVLSAEDSVQRFGVDLNAAGIQPVWVEVENGGGDMLWLLHAGTDPDYFSPLEVAWSFHTFLGGARNDAIDDHFDRLAFPNPIPPGATRAGIIFTNPHHRTRVLNVDLLGQRRLLPFTLFLPVPDSADDETALQIQTLARHSDAAERQFGQPDALRAALERLPCCAAHAEHGLPGDPLNVVLVGHFDHMAAAMIRRGFRSDRRPVDDTQRVFGRRPDVVGRMVGRPDAPAHRVRLWIAPFRYQGKPVFVGQVGRPSGGRLRGAGAQDLATHPNVDEVRNVLVQDLLYSGGLAKLGFVEGRGGTDRVSAAESPGESRYRTDGLRVVMFFAARPLSLSDTEILDWVPALELQEAEAAARRVPVAP